MSGTPRIGFGCASLGSRISAADGLAALERAYAAGIRWFDVAPSYGDGEAEILLGRFLRSHPDATVATKVGIMPPAPSLAKRVARPIVRGLLALAPGMRGAIKRRRPAMVKPPLTAAMMTASIDASLRRLGRERVEVLALHEASPQEVARDDILRAAEDILSAGKAARLSVASSVDAARAALAASDLYGVVQLANNPLAPNLALVAPALPAGRPVVPITHTAFGADGMIEAIAARIATEPELAAAFRQAGYDGDARTTTLAFLPDYAFATNPDGIVLLSMFKRGHLDANLARLTLPRDTAAIRSLGSMLAG